VTRRIIACLFAALLLISPVSQALAAPPQPEAHASPEAPHISPEVWAQVAGALVGFGLYSLYVAPGAGLVGGLAAVAGTRIVAATLAGTGAVIGTFIYDRWTGQPLDYAYFWHRGGFIAGIAAGIAVFGVLGYPIDGGVTWLGWVANRVVLLGSGVLGSWWADSWYGVPAPAAPVQ
jgi:hypothetical protein